MTTFELVPDIGCIGLVGLLYHEVSEKYPELIANLDTDELSELKLVIEQYLNEKEKAL